MNSGSIIKISDEEEMIGWSNITQITEVDFTVPISSIVTLPYSIKSILTALNLILLIFAICGNLAAIVIILRSRLSRKSTKWLLLTLSISDIILVISSIPVDLGTISSKNHSWTMGSFLCENVSFFQMGAVIMNAFALFTIALERYFVVTRSLIKKPRKSCLSCTWIPYFRILCVWILPIALAVPQLWSYKTFSYKTYNDDVNSSDIVLSNETYYICYQRYSPKSAIFFNSILYCIAGFVFICLLSGFLFCYLSIIHFIKAQGCKFNRTKSGLETSTGTSGSEITLNSNFNVEGKPPKRPRNRHRKTIRLIITLILIFCICRIPVWVFLIYTTITQPKYTRIMLILQKFLHILSNLSAGLSPLFYAIWNNSLKSKERKYPRHKNKRRGKGFTRWISTKNGRTQKNALAIFVISKVRHDRYDFACQSYSRNELIEETNGIIWKQRSSTNKFY